VQAILRPLGAYTDWVLSLRPIWLSAAIFLAPVVFIAVVAYLLLFSGGDSSDDSTSQACSTFGSADARAFCEGDTSGETADFRGHVHAHVGGAGDLREDRLARLIA
jgi:hypothetical protein